MSTAPAAVTPLVKTIPREGAEIAPVIVPCAHEAALVAEVPAHEAPFGIAVTTPFESIVATLRPALQSLRKALVPPPVAVFAARMPLASAPAALVAAADQSFGSPGIAVSPLAKVRALLAPRLTDPTTVAVTAMLGSKLPALGSLHPALGPEITALAALGPEPATFPVLAAFGAELPARLAAGAAIDREMRATFAATTTLGSGLAALRAVATPTLGAKLRPFATALTALGARLAAFTAAATVGALLVAAAAVAASAFLGKHRRSRRRGHQQDDEALLHGSILHV